VEIDLSSDEELDMLGFDLYEVPRVTMNAKELVEQLSGLDVGADRDRTFVFSIQVSFERIKVDREVTV